MSAESDFIALMTPYAQQAAAATGWSPALIMAQWGNETGWGTSSAWKNYHNPAGIGITGSGVAGKNYGSIQGGVQAYIDFIKNNSRYAGVASAGNADQQAVALANAGWAAGGYNNGGGPGSDLVSQMNSWQQDGVNIGGPAITGDQANAINAYIATLPADQQASVRSYLEAGAPTAASGSNAAGASSASAAAAPSNPGQAAGSTEIGGQAYNGTQSEISALDTIQSTLNSYGLGSLTSWAWGEIVNGTDPTQLPLDLMQTPQFQAAFPGFTDANATRVSKGLPAMSVGDYQTYMANAQQLARTAGLPAGFMTAAEVNTLVSNDVSAAELSNRITDAVNLAVNSSPQAQTAFANYFGSKYGVTGSGPGGALTIGQTAALALNPTTAEPLLQQELTAAQIGGEGVTTGVGDIGVGLATKLAQNGVTQAQANSGFQQIAPLSPLEHALPGMENQPQANVSIDTLASSQLLGDATSQRAVQVAQEIRKAPFQGGGGFTQTAKGVAGAGSASGSGATG